MRKFLDAFQSVAEYLIAAVFIYGSLSLIGRPAINAPGVIWKIFGGEGALYVYMIWFMFLGLALLFSKVRKRKKLHKNILLCIYLTTIYTAILALALYGDPLVIVDDAIVGITAAIFWLRWKFKTEYVDPLQFQRVTDKYRSDLPPTTKE